MAEIAGAGEQALEFNCSMAQAFEIPRGKPDSAFRTCCGSLKPPSPGTKQRFPDRRSRSDPAVDRQLEYGFGFGPPQAYRRYPAAPVTGPIPGSAIPATLIVSGEFDKGTPRPIWRSLSAALWPMIRYCMDLDRFLAEPAPPVRTRVSRNNQSGSAQEKSPAETAGLLHSTGGAPISARPG